MVDATDEVRRDIEMTRERMSAALSQLERKVNVMQHVRDHPWPALGIAFGTGVVLSRSATDLRAAAAGGVARTARSHSVRARASGVLDEIVAQLLLGVGEVARTQVDKLVAEMKEALNGRTGPGERATRGPGSPPSR